jgi:uncharacterized RDD family membrane protein YckC
VSNYDPSAPGNQQPWGAPPPDGQPPASDWGAVPGAGAPGQPPYGGQQLPPYGQFGSSQANWAPTASPQGELALWPQRALGWVVDWAIGAVPYIVLFILSRAVGTLFFSVIGALWALAIAIWFSIQVGQYGTTPGMRVAGLKCVKAGTGQTIGGGLGFVRGLIHVVASWLCFVPFIIDMLFPLWDAQRQTLADKIMGTVVLKVPPEGFSITPKTTR